MSDIEEMKYFFGMEIDQCDDGIFISQKKFALDLLKNIHIERSKAVANPLVVKENLSKNDDSDKVDASFYRSLIGNLLYLSSTRPDIMFSASILFRFMHFTKLNAS